MISKDSCRFSRKSREEPGLIALARSEGVRSAVGDVCGEHLAVDAPGLALLAADARHEGPEFHGLLGGKPQACFDPLEARVQVGEQVQSVIAEQSPLAFPLVRG